MERRKLCTVNLTLSVGSLLMSRILFPKPPAFCEKAFVFVFHVKSFRSQSLEKVANFSRDTFIFLY